MDTEQQEHTDLTPAALPAEIAQQPGAIDLYKFAIWALAGIGAVGVLGMIVVPALGRTVGDGVQPWGRTVMHTPDGATYTNVDPPPEAPDLRTVGEKVAELGEAVAALQDDSGHTAHKLRELTARVEHMERLLHRLLNPGEQEGGE